MIYLPSSFRVEEDNPLSMWWTKTKPWLLRLHYYKNNVNLTNLQLSTMTLIFPSKFRKSSKLIISFSCNFRSLVVLCLCPVVRNTFCKLDFFFFERPKLRYVSYVIYPLRFPGIHCWYSWGRILNNVMFTRIRSQKC